MATVKPPSRFATQDLTTRQKPNSSTSRDSTPLSSHVEWRRRTWDTEVDDALKIAPSFWRNRRCMMSIYIPNLWLNLWYRGENAHFLLTWKIRIARKFGKINGGQNQHLEARNQAPFSPELALFPFKKRCFMRYFESTPQSTTWIFLTPKEKQLHPYSYTSHQHKTKGCDKMQNHLFYRL